MTARRRVRPLLVGQAPSMTGEGRAPFDFGGSGRRIARLAGLDPETYAELCRHLEPVNLIERFPGKDGRGDAFPWREARDVAALLRESNAGRTLVLCGRGVARAFGLQGVPPLEVRGHGDIVSVTIPPSQRHQPLVQ